MKSQTSWITYQIVDQKTGALVQNCKSELSILFNTVLSEERGGCSGAAQLS